MFYRQCNKCGERWGLGTPSTCKCDTVNDGETLGYLNPKQIDTNKLYISPSAGGYGYSTIKVTEYEVDWDKVQTIDDLKRVIKSMGIRFNGDHWISGLEDLVRVVVK